VDDHYEPGEPGTDPDGLGSDGLDALGGDALGGDALGGDPHDLGPDGLDLPEPDHDALADLDTADTADLSFADEYGPGVDGSPPEAGLPEAGLGGHSPIGYGDLGYGDLSADLPDHLHDTLGGGEVPFGANPDLYPLPDTDLGAGLGADLGAGLGPDGPFPPALDLPDTDLGAGLGADLGAGLGPDGPFPPALDLPAPEPVDGYPWADPATLGQEPLPPLDDPVATAGGPGTAGAPQPAELYEYAGESPPAGGDAWADLLASPDPATSALARWWSPG
jgi:hypothetical protein